MSKWQPITTAPKDMRILAYAPADGVMIVHWGTSEPFGDAPTWITDNEGPGYSSEVEATHWMPLPDAPEHGPSKEASND